jgi:hypothetical protein
MLVSFGISGWNRISVAVVMLRLSAFVVFLLSSASGRGVGALRIVLRSGPATPIFFSTAVLAVGVSLECS